MKTMLNRILVMLCVCAMLSVAACASKGSSGPGEAAVAEEERGLEINSGTPGPGME